MGREYILSFFLRFHIIFSWSKWNFFESILKKIISILSLFAINFESQTTALKLYLILFFSPSTYFMRGIRRVACTSNHHCQNVSIMDFEIDFRLGGLIYTEKKHTFKQSSFRPHQYTWFLLQGMSEIQFRCRTERRRLDTKKNNNNKIHDKTGHWS